MSYTNWYFHTTCTTIYNSHMMYIRTNISQPSHIFSRSLPHGNSLQYVRQLGETVLTNIESSSGTITDAYITIGAGLPPIPPN